MSPKRTWTEKFVNVPPTGLSSKQLRSDKVALGMIQLWHKKLWFARTCSTCKDKVHRWAWAVKSQNLDGLTNGTYYFCFRCARNEGEAADQAYRLAHRNKKKVLARKYKAG